MALIVNDRVRESTTVTGTGTATLLGAIAGYQAFSVIGNGNTCYYTISDQLGANWEVGIGTYTLSGTTLARTTVLKSSNANALVSFTAGTKDVFVTYPAETSVSGGGGGVYPTTQPSLNLDFANTKQLDPRITFVRNSTATYYDGQTTALAEQNLLLQSNTFSNAAWVATNGTVVSGVTDPAGTTTAFSFTATGVATLYQTLTTTATPYTLSFYIQRVTGTGAVNLTLDGTTLTAQTITGSWARYSVTATPTAASHTIGIQLAVITDSVNIFSSQLENRSSMTAANITTTAAITNYIPVLMTAPAGVARFDCDPITGKSLGLLIEESRTNLLGYSSDFSNAAWTKFTSTITADTIIAPDGTLTGDTFTTTVIAHALYEAITVTASTVYTFSWYAKLSTLTPKYCVYNQTGSADIIAPSLYPTGTSVGNGWFRYSATFTTPVGCVTARIYPLRDSGTTGDIYIWGAQLEAGSFATSYIPTVASTVTRATDNASMTGTNFSSWYNQAQGSFYCDGDFNETNPSSNAMFMEGGASNGAITLGSIGAASSTLMRFQARNTTTNPTGSAVITYSFIVNASIKGAFIYNGLSGLTCALNGITYAGSASTTGEPTPPDRIHLGSRGGNSFFTNGHIRKLTYYPIALSSSNLVALTS